MQSPFKIFRKHQKVALAALTLMAMIGFGLGDVFYKMGSPAGSRREGKVIFETNIGNLTEMEIHHLASERQIVQRFIVSAFVEANPKMAQFANIIVRQVGFGGTSEGEMLEKWLMRHEAGKLGITVSESQIREFINHVTGFVGGKKLSDKQFQQIVRDLHISSKQLYEMLRHELQIANARRLTQAAPLPSPETYWRDFQHLNTRQKIAVAAVPVNAFTEKTGDPSAAQIENLFNQHQYDEENAVNGEFRPGFLQPQKVQLHYLEVSHDEVRKKVLAGAPITDQDIVDYYESKKETTSWMQERPPAPDDDQTPIDPEMTPEKGEKPAKDDSQGPKLNLPKDSEPDEKPSEKDAKPQPKQEEAEKQESGAAPDKKEDKAPECRTNGSDEETQDAKPQTKDEAADSSEKEKAEKNEARKGEEEPKTEDDKPGAPEQGEGKPTIAPPPEVKFKPLDDTLREMIRERILEARTSDLVKETVANVRKAMGSVAESFASSSEIKLVEADEQQLAELDKRSEQELQKIADQFGVAFHKTGLVSADELHEIPGLGVAFDPESQMTMRGGMTTIIQQAFSTDALCQLFESESMNPGHFARYVSWKVRDVPAHIPELKDPGIREQVVAAWKRIEAQKLAEKRALDLAQRARTSGKELREELADQTVTGTSVGPSLTLEESVEFSYWNEISVPNSMSSASQAQVRPGDPGCVTKPGRKFMQIVCDQLATGETGVALNDDASVYYVVKVLSRREADREEFKDAKLFDQGSAYAQINQIERQEFGREHAERMRVKYAIRMKELPRRTSRPMVFDDEF